MRQRRRLFNLVKGDPRFETVRMETETPTLYLYDEISYWGVSAADFVAELSGLDNKDFTLRVNSPGGDVFEGISILNNLRNYPGRVTAVVDGMAASAASFILMGCDEVVMSRNTELMIHDAWGVCMGNSADMRDTADRLDKVSDNIADVYGQKAGAPDGIDPATHWRAEMQKEIWYSAEEAVAVGLADRVDSTASTSNDVTYDLSHFKVANKNKKEPVIESFDWNPQEVLRAFEEAWI